MLLLFIDKTETSPREASVILAGRLLLSAGELDFCGDGLAICGVEFDMVVALGREDQIRHGCNIGKALDRSSIDNDGQRLLLGGRHRSYRHRGELAIEIHGALSASIDSKFAICGVEAYIHILALVVR